jgi:hypothetical protein
MALPVGLSLMFKTSLEVYGWFIGLFIGLSTVIVSQFIIIFRTNWTGYAQMVKIIPVFIYFESKLF